LDGISADLVQRFEQELFSFLPKSVFHAIFNFYLRSELDDDLMIFFLTSFRKYFIENIVKLA